MNAPLKIASAPSLLNADTAALLKNKELIAINQDLKNEQATIVSNKSSTFILARVLEDGRVVMCFFNNGQTPA